MGIRGSTRGAGRRGTPFLHQALRARDTPKRPCVAAQHGVRRHLAIALSLRCPCGQRCILVRWVALLNVNLCAIDGVPACGGQVWPATAGERRGRSFHLPLGLRRRLDARQERFGSAVLCSVESPARRRSTDATAGVPGEPGEPSGPSGPAIASRRIHARDLPTWPLLDPHAIAAHGQAAAQQPCDRILHRPCA